MTALLLLAAFACSAVFEWLTVEWHDARERGEVWRGTVIAAVLEALHYAPLVIAIDTGDPGALIAAIVGGIVGAHVGLRGARRRVRARNLHSR